MNAMLLLYFLSTLRHLYKHISMFCCLKSEEVMCFMMMYLNHSTLRPCRHLCVLLLKPLAKIQHVTSCFCLLPTTFSIFNAQRQFSIKTCLRLQYTAYLAEGEKSKRLNKIDYSQPIIWCLIRSIKSSIWIGIRYRRCIINWNLIIWQMAGRKSDSRKKSGQQQLFPYYTFNFVFQSCLLYFRSHFIPSRSLIFIVSKIEICSGHINFSWISLNCTSFRLHFFLLPTLLTVINLSLFPDSFFLLAQCFILNWITVTSHILTFFLSSFSILTSDWMNEWMNENKEK